MHLSQPVAQLHGGIVAGDAVYALCCVETALAVRSEITRISALWGLVTALGTLWGKGQVLTGAHKPGAGGEGGHDICGREEGSGKLAGGDCRTYFLCRRCAV